MTLISFHQPHSSLTDMQSAYGQHKHIRSAGVVYMADKMMLWDKLDLPFQHMFAQHQWCDHVLLRGQGRTHQKPLRLQAPHPLSKCRPTPPRPQHSQYAVAHRYGLACGLQTEGRLLNTKHTCQDNVSQRPLAGIAADVDACRYRLRMQQY